MTGPKPSVGRIVHYVNIGDKEGKFKPDIVPSIITGIYFAGPNGVDDVQGDRVSVGDKPTEISSKVDLKNFYRCGHFDMTAVPFSDSYKRGHWTWPPRE